MLQANKPVLLLGGGVINPVVVDALAPQALIMAVDGGGNYAERHGLDVSCVVGDGDSLAGSSSYRADGRFSLLEDQNNTDFAKALQHVQAPLIIGVGFIEDRLDHALAALNVLSRTDKPVVLVGQSEAVMVVHRQILQLQVPCGLRLSIWPLQPICFRASQGLKYALNGLTLQPGGRIGTSNQTEAEKVQIVAHSVLDVGYALMIPWPHFPSLCRVFEPSFVSETP